MTRLPDLATIPPDRETVHRFFTILSTQVAYAAEAAGIKKPGYLQLTKLWPQSRQGR